MPPPSPAADVAAHPVVVELVVVVAGAEGGAAAARQRAGEQLIAERGVVGDAVVVHVDVQLQAIRQVRDRSRLPSWQEGAHRAQSPAPVPPTTPGSERIGELTLANADAARERARIVVDPVVGDLQVMRPAVHEDAAAALGAVGDGQTIDARRVAIEVARDTGWERVRSSLHSCGRAIVVAAR